MSTSKLHIYRVYPEDEDALLNIVIKEGINRMNWPMTRFFDLLISEEDLLALSLKTPIAKYWLIVD